MAQFPRLTIFFEDGKYGWSESHFYRAPVTDLHQVINDGVILARARADLLGTGPTINELRASFDDVFRDSFINVFNPPLQTTLFAGGGSVPPEVTSDLPYSVTLLRLESGANYRRSLYLSGVPDAYQLDPNAQYGAQWETNFGLWADQLADDPVNQTTGLWGFKALQRPPDVPTFPITGITFGLPTIITAVGNTFTVGQRIHIRLVKQTPKKPSVNGFWYVLAKTGDQVTLANSSFAGEAYLGGGIVYDAQTYAIKPYTDVRIVRETHRKRGRPFDCPHGRLARTH